MVYPMIGESIAANWFGQRMQVKNKNSTWVNNAMVTFVSRKTTHLLSKSFGLYEFYSILGNETLNSDFNFLQNNQGLMPLQQNLTGVYPMQVKAYENIQKEKAF